MAVVGIKSSLVGTSVVSLYTWSTGVAECNSVDVFNRLTSQVLVDLYLDDNGTAIYLVKDYPLPGKTPMPYRGAVVFSSTGQILKVKSDTAASLDVVGRVLEH